MSNAISPTEKPTLALAIWASLGRKGAPAADPNRMTPIWSCSSMGISRLSRDRHGWDDDEIRDEGHHDKTRISKWLQDLVEGQCETHAQHARHDEREREEILERGQGLAHSASRVLEGPGDARPGRHPPTMGRAGRCAGGGYSLGIRPGTPDADVCPQATGASRRAGGSGTILMTGPGSRHGSACPCPVGSRCCSARASTPPGRPGCPARRRA